MTKVWNTLRSKILETEYLPLGKVFTPTPYLQRYNAKQVNMNCCYTLYTDLFIVMGENYYYVVYTIQKAKPRLF